MHKLFIHYHNILKYIACYTLYCIKLKLYLECRNNHIILQGQKAPHGLVTNSKNIFWSRSFVKEELAVTYLLRLFSLKLRLYLPDFQSENLIWPS